jgi:probable F420-dependent oxidoreductase
MARAVEDLGFDSIWVSDHIVVPEGSSYIPEFMTEPLAVLAFLAAETRHVTLGTSVLILPYRSPIFTAKFLGSVDYLANGRLVIGIGAGWLEEEFEALGVPFAERGPRTDEALRVMRDLWETDTSSFEGRWTSYQRMRLFPKKAESRRTTIPVLVGGNGRASVRRAAELGDGWHPINIGPADFPEAMAAYRAECARFGRQPGAVCMRHMPGGRTRPRGDRWPLSGTVEEQAEDIRAYGAAGVDDLMLSIPHRSLPEMLTTLRAFMREVAPRV